MNIEINPERNEWSKLIERPAVSNEHIQPLVKEVFAIVRKNGDKALQKYTQLFDHIAIDDFKVSATQIAAAEQMVAEPLKKAIQIAAQNIRAFHSSQENKAEKIETTKGVICWQEARPIERIGIYIPGGTAPLFSTVLMLAIPAKIAGCKEIVLCTPPGKNGSVNPAILYAANLVGVSQVYQVGGVQAIAALSIGTETVPKVYKIFGPGNQFVTAAKQFAQQLGVAIDMPAGPSELLVMADKTADPDFVAADLLSQAEHGADSQVVSVLASEDLVEPVQQALMNQLADLPRAEIAKKALENSRLLVIEDKEERIAFVNQYAPEHLIIAENNAEEVLQRIKNAGSVFLGNYTPESAGDYASGTNHTLPTNGFAKSYSGVNLDAFTKKITVQNITPEGIINLGETIELMAQAESLYAHKNAVTLRLKKLENEN